MGMLERHNHNLISYENCNLVATEKLFRVRSKKEKYSHYNLRYQLCISQPKKALAKKKKT